jgi:hypothetical protein
MAIIKYNRHLNPNGIIVSLLTKSIVATEISIETIAKRGEAWTCLSKLQCLN